MVTQTTTRFTVITRPELKAVADEIARENKTSRSKVVSQCLEELARSRKERLMIEFYKTMARENREFAKKSVKVIQEIATSWSD
jgi:hypothetical protein